MDNNHEPAEKMENVTNQEFDYRNLLELIEQHVPNPSQLEYIKIRLFSLVQTMELQKRKLWLAQQKIFDLTKERDDASIKAERLKTATVRLRKQVKATKGELIDVEGIRKKHEQLEEMYKAELSKKRQHYKPTNTHGTTAHGKKSSTATGNLKREIEENQEYWQFTSNGEIYKITEIIGRGGMAITYKAQKSSTGENVVIKEMFSDQTKQFQALCRFLQEAFTLFKEFNHPNIVKAHDYLISPDNCFYVMEYIEGNPLNDFIENNNSLSPKRACQIAIDIVNALQYLKTRNVVHRDIKPQNIIIKKPNKPVLVDFGITKKLGHNYSLTMEGEVVGTYLYLSPEQVTNKNIDTRSDQYNLGATLFHVLTGVPPFNTNNVYELLTQRAIETPDIKNIKPNLPNLLANIVKKMMAIEPQDRYQNLTKLEHDLSLFIK
jgi:serine/threonine protein kinase